MDPVNERADQDLGQLSYKSSSREYLLPFEAMDILVLNQFIPSHYRPNDAPLAMVVGYSCIREAEILRAFHEDSFGLTPSALKVVGCNIGDRPSAGTTDSIDKLYMGHYEGDARDSFTWFKPLVDLGFEDRLSYDLAYIRNPDLYDVRDWGAVFAQAVERTCETGVVATLVRRDDIHRFDRLTKHLKSQYDLDPLLVTETGMNLEDDPLKQHFLLALFQGQAK